MAGSSGARATAAGRFFGVAQIVDCLKWSVRPNIMQDIILFRGTDPGELCPVKLDFGAADKLVEVERGIKSTQRQSIRFSNGIDVVCRHRPARSRHVLRDDIGVPWNIFTDKTRHVARPEVVATSCRGANDEPDGFPLIVGSLGEEIHAPARQQRKKEERSTLLRSWRKPNRPLKKACTCFDRLSTNGESPTIPAPDPFALSLSKGEHEIF